jgi:competence protein ComEA
LAYVLLIAACTQQRIESRSTYSPPLSESAININTATKEELAKIPYIGDKSATKIVEHREKHGPFRKPEHLMLVEGISDKKFRLIRNLIRT